MLGSHSVCCVVLFVAGALLALGCTTEPVASESGSLSLDLTIADGVEIDEVQWEITGGEMDPMSGMINTSAPGSTASVEVFGIPAGEDYSIVLTASSSDGEVFCQGSALFDITVGQATPVAVMLNCKPQRRFGAVRVNGSFNICAELIKAVVAPLQTSIGHDIDLASAAVDADDDPVAYAWTATGGSIADSAAASTTYTCDEPGSHSITIQVSDDGFEDCVSEWTVRVDCVGDDGGTGGTGGVGGSGGAGGDGTTIEELVGSVDASRYETDLNTVAVVRNHGSAAWQATQDLCADRLASLGFAVERQAYGTGVNVIGTLAGQTDTQIIVSAHYDAVPDCDAADDNATGVAGALEAARVLSAARYDRTLVVACWDEEERGLIGARHYATQARNQDVDIEAMYSLEMIGYATDEPDTQLLPVGFAALFPGQVAQVAANDFRGDFITIVADLRSLPMISAFERVADDVGLPWIELALLDQFLTSPATGDLRRSDHAPFWAEGYPGIMITDSSEFRNLNYHCRNGLRDTADRLDTDFAVKVVQSVVGATAEIAVIVP